MTNSCILLQRLSSVSSFSFLLLMPNLWTTMATINATNGTNKLVLPLVHRDSILPLFHNPKDHLQSLSHDDIGGPLVPSPYASILLVNISIGEPPFSLLLGMDTGSPITWVQGPFCTESCTSNYDREASSTYTSISCSSKNECIEYFDQLSDDCSQESRCTYTVRYLDNARSSGIIALEKFTFSTSTGGIIGIPNSVFGYSLGTDEPGDTPNGLLGLQPLNEYSLVSRVGNKFSYCLGNISDPYYMYNLLILGEGAILEGDSTPMKVNEDGYYTVKLEGISIGDRQLQIHQQEFDYNVVIDSGSTLTYLTRSAFEQLKGEVMRLLDGVLETVTIDEAGEIPCYRGSLMRDLEGFPIVSLKLDKGAEIDLDVEGLFRRVSDDEFCMAVDVSSGDEINIIGIFAQQYYNVGFDFNAMEVSFQRIDCELLEE